FCFLFTHPAPTATHPLSLHDALPISMSEFLLGRAWDMVILDESHKIKAPGGKASLFCARLGQRAVNRLILTGTPMPHSPLDIYADRKSTRLNSSHVKISYAVFCLKKK